MKRIKKTLLWIAFLFWTISFSNSAWAWVSDVTGGRCKTTGNSCRSTIGNAGGAYACCDPQNSNVTNCVNTNPCIGGQIVKWFALPVAWGFNANNVAGTAGFRNFNATTLETYTKTAWSWWQAPTCTSFKQSYTGTTTTNIDSNDKKNVVVLSTASQWANYGASTSTLAFTLPVYYNNGEIIDADILVQPYVSGSYAWDKDKYISTIAHEAGHAVGIAHSPDIGALMYFSSVTNYYSLPKDDTNAICGTYPQTGPCSTDADCGGCQECKNKVCVYKVIATAAKACKPWRTYQDCGGIINASIEQGNRCLQTCDSNKCCPTGYRCSGVGSGQQLCIPLSGYCPDVGCTTETDCGLGEQCSSGKCRAKTVTTLATSCKTCKSDADCGGNGSICLSSGVRSLCSQPCEGNNFCPSGYACVAQAGSVTSYCIPQDGICPCTSSSQCNSGETCSGSLCQKSGGGTYYDVCNDKVPCAPSYQCLSLGNQSVCIQLCGKSAQSAGSSFPLGSPGGACKSNGTCDLGATCYQLQGGSGNVCLRDCSSNSCSFGGTCYNYGGQNLCLCQANNECNSGQSCNSSLFRNFGACAVPTSVSTSCPSNYTCQANGSLELCIPKGTKEVGETCNENPTDNCKDGLLCIRTSQTASSGVCLEDCSTSNTCQYGGSCTALTSGKGCFCSQDSECPSGKICDKKFGSVGVCAVKKAPVCGDGTCNTGENCNTCALDCVCRTGQVCNAQGTCEVKAECGNGLCDTNENCSTCAQDCQCRTGYVCTTSGTCQTQASCGNGTCESSQNENCTSCPQDCGCPSGTQCSNSTCNKVEHCGNGTCESSQGENCSTCQKDCSCASGSLCDSGTCRQAVQCGNGSCQADQGENCNSCPQDCGCVSGKICINQLCVVEEKAVSPDAGTLEKTTLETIQVTDSTITPLDCAVSEQMTVCDDNGRNCKTICADQNCPTSERVTKCDDRGRNCREVCVTGCGCSASPRPSDSFFFLLLGLLFLFSLQRRRA